MLSRCDRSVSSQLHATMRALRLSYLTVCVVSSAMSPVCLVRDELRALLVPIDSLRPHPDNPRRGQIEPIAASLQMHGQYRPLVCQLDGTVLAGNHTLAAARALGWSHVAATMLDVDDETARRILLVDNRTSDLATYDDRELVRLLDELTHTEAGLAGTAFDDAELQRLLAVLEPVPIDDVLSPFDRSAEHHCPFCDATWHETADGPVLVES